MMFCVAHKIHISDATKMVLDLIGGFDLELRGTIAVKVSDRVEEIGVFWILPPSAYLKMAALPLIQGSMHLLRQRFIE